MSLGQLCYLNQAMLFGCNRQHGKPPLVQRMRALLCAARRPVRHLTRAISVYAEMAPKNAAQKAHYSSHLQVYNVDNSTAAPSVLLFFDNKRYLFNAGEGIQRHFIEYKQKMNKITSVLATRVSTDTLAGLPGMLLSQVTPGSDGSGDNAIKSEVFGPEGLSRYCIAFRQYASSFKLNWHEVGAGQGRQLINDSFVTITAVPITPTNSSSTQPAATAQAQAEQAAAGANADADAADTAAQEPAAKRQRTDDSSASTSAVAAAGLGPGMSQLAPVVLCYVCQLSSIPGKIDPKKCAALGVPSGPMLGQLQRGNPVTLADGTVIQPHEAMATQETPGACLILVDCPSLSYLPNLQAAAQLQQVQQQAQQQHELQLGQANDGKPNSTAMKPSRKFVLVHLGPSNVVRSEPYRSWQLGFGPGVEHVVVSSDSQLNPTTQRAAVLQAQLNAIEPQVFSLQGFHSLLQQQRQQQDDGAVAAAAQTGANGGTDGNTKALEADGQNINMVTAANGYRFTLAPFKHQGPSTEGVSAAPDLEAVQAGVQDAKRAVLLQLIEQYTAAKAEVLGQPTPPQLQGIGRRSAELTLLGTCSACPSNHRNVSAYYLDLFDRGGLLMDCGEDTMGQLERRFGRAEAAQRVLNLNAIWVSHMHADHHGGLYPLLLHRQQLQQQAASSQNGNISDTSQRKPVIILGPWPLFRALTEYSKVLELQFQFLPNTHFYAPAPHPPPAAAVEAFEAAKAAAGLTVLQPFPVKHVAHSTGLQLESKDGWKIVFSGDTRPCDSVVEAAKGATLLVHEATFEDELQDDAVAKKHSTTSEALGVAAAAGAYRTVLTHFSTRYPKIPVMKQPAQAAAVLGRVPAAEQQQQAAGGDDSTAATAADTAVAAAAPLGSDLAAVGSVMVGFDLMSINLADLPWLPKTLPVLDELFKEEEAAYQQDDEVVPV